MKKLKFLMVFSMLLIVTHLFAGNFCHGRNFSPSPFGSKFYAPVSNELTNDIICSAVVAERLYSSGESIRSFDILFLEYDEDEENEVHSFSKETKLSQEVVHKNPFSGSYVDAFKAQLGALNDQVINNEDVYLLYQVLRI